MRCWMTEQNQLTFADSSLRKCQVVYRFCSSRLVKAIAGRKQPVRRIETDDDKQTGSKAKRTRHRANASHERVGWYGSRVLCRRIEAAGPARRGLRVRMRELCHPATRRRDPAYGRQGT